MLHFSPRKAISQAFIRMNNATDYHLDFFSREDDFSRKSLPNEALFGREIRPNNATMLTVVNAYRKNLLTLSGYTAATSPVNTLLAC